MPTTDIELSALTTMFTISGTLTYLDKQDRSAQVRPEIENLSDPEEKLLEIAATKKPVKRV